MRHTGTGMEGQGQCTHNCKRIDTICYSLRDAIEQRAFDCLWLFRCSLSWASSTNFYLNWHSIPLSLETRPMSLYFPCTWERRVDFVAMAVDVEYRDRKRRRSACPLDPVSISLHPYLCRALFCSLFAFLSWASESLSLSLSLSLSSDMVLPRSIARSEWIYVSEIMSHPGRINKRILG